MKKNFIRILSIVLLLYTCCIIFNFSNQNGEESSGVSKRVTDSIVSNILQVSGQEQKEEITRKLEPIIRKLAHFSIYTLVGFLLMTVVSTYQLKEIKRIFISLGTGILYASLDEIHQSFIPGRSAKVTDVCIDTMGVILGISVVVIVLKMITTNEHKNVEK